MTDEKTCFVISPIGPEDSDIRKRADKLLEHIIRPAIREYGYEAVRSDEITDPGNITTQVIEKTVESDLVIADLTNHNPNVFYELAVRHATSKPYIQLIDSAESIPFDISDIRTIYYDFDVESAEKARKDISKHLDSIEESESDFPTPISQAADLSFWRESEDPVQQNLADISASISQLNSRMNSIEDMIKGHRLVRDEFGLFRGERDVIEKILESNPEIVEYISRSPTKSSVSRRSLNVSNRTDVGGASTAKKASTDDTERE